MTVPGNLPADSTFGGQFTAAQENAVEETMNADTPVLGADSPGGVHQVLGSIAPPPPASRDHEANREEPPTGPYTGRGENRTSRRHPNREPRRRLPTPTQPRKPSIPTGLGHAAETVPSAGFPPQHR